MLVVWGAKGGGGSPGAPPTLLAAMSSSSMASAAATTAATTDSGEAPAAAAAEAATALSLTAESARLTAVGRLRARRQHQIIRGHAHTDLNPSRAPHLVTR
jgi:hypothetical protein